MTKLTLLALLAAPVLVFGQEEAVNYQLTAGGLIFMGVTWTAIIVWNVVCFSKILKNQEK